MSESRRLPRCTVGPWQPEGWQDVPRSAWDSTVAASDDAWLWHSLEYQEALGTWATRENVSLAVMAGDSIGAILPLQLVALKRNRVLPYRQLHSQGGAAFAPHLSKLDRAEVARTMRDAVLRLAAARHANEIVFVSTPVAPSWRDFGDSPNPHVDIGLAATLGQSWVSDLRGGPEAVWSAMEGRSRTSIRKAERDGVEVRVGGVDDLTAYYDLHRTTYSRTGMRPHARLYFDHIWRDFVARGTARVFVAERDAVVIAAQTFAVGKSAAVYWTGASSEEALRLGANNLVQWTAMRELMSDGVEWFEHGEAFPQAVGKLKGLNDFKRSFGGSLWSVPGGRIDRSSMSFRVAASALDRVRSSARRLRGRHD